MTASIARSGAAERTGRADEHPPLRVALVGNPNVGKTTLFNSLTGMRQKVANWPGTTVEYVTGVASFGGQLLQVTDLPGIYGLAAYADDERVTRRFLLHEEPDVAIVVVDAASLERNLFLVVETLELFGRVIVALNKVDVAEARGHSVDAHTLSARLGVPVVSVQAHRQAGIDDLIAATLAVARREWHTTPTAVPYGPDVEAAVGAVAAHLAEDGVAGDHRWAALRLLQGDVEALDRVRAESIGSVPLPGGGSCCDTADLRFTVEPAAGDPLVYVNGFAPRQEAFELEIAGARYDWIRGVAADCVRQSVPTRAEWTPWLDRVLLHPIWGYAWLAAIFGAVFWLAFQASVPLSDLVQQAIAGLGDRSDGLLGGLGAPDWLRSLVLNGAFKGIGAVLSFVPYMAVFFAGMALLETSGYMARASLLADRFMQAAGLHGRSLFPLVSAFGCNVPALTATRTMENPRDRLLTGLVIPFLPCNARLGVIAVVSGAFFRGGTAGLVMLGLVLASLVVVAGVALFYRRTVLPSEPTPLLLELSPYSMPRWQDVGIPTLLRVWAFVSRIWKFLLPATVVVWALTYFPVGAPPEASYAATIGGWLTPLGAPLGFDWRLMLAILFGFVAKETTLDTLGVVYGMSGDGPLGEALAASMSPLVALVFLLVYMLYVPCLATVVQMKREMGSSRWAAVGVIVNVVVAFGLGLLVRQAAVLLGLGA